MENPISRNLKIALHYKLQRNPKAKKKDIDARQKTEEFELNNFDDLSDVKEMLSLMTDCEKFHDSNERVFHENHNARQDFNLGNRKTIILFKGKDFILRKTKRNRKIN